MTLLSSSRTVAAVILLAGASAGASVAAAERLPRAFHGTWATDLAQCSETGESSPTRIDGRFILQYESGWTIKRWSRRGDVWIGRGTEGDDQGSTPASVRLRLRPDDKLAFDTSLKGPMSDDPGWIRCPPESLPRR